MLFLLSFFRQRGALRLAAVLLAMAAAAAPVAAASDESYYSVVESGVTVERAAEAQPAEEDQLVFAGDRLTTTFSARAEVILADSVIRVGGGSDVVFAALAEPGDGDAGDSPHLLLLEQGELLVASEGATAIRIDTDNATVFVRAGSCRIERDAESTVMTVRRGEVELRTRQGAVVVAADERAWVWGDEAPVVEPAGGSDALERWAASLDARRERLASSTSRLRSWWGGFWSVFWEDDGYDSVFHSVDIGDCDDGVTVCRHGSGGGAARTRPPQTATDPDEPAEDEPGTPGDGPIEIALTKPWPPDGADPTEPVPFPVGKPPLDTNVSESPVPLTAGVAVAGIEGPEAAAPKPSADESPQPDATSTVDDNVSTTSDASTTSEPSSSDTSTADSSSASVEPVTTSYDTTTTVTTSTDSGGFSPEPSAPEAPPPPEHGIEPNR